MASQSSSLHDELWMYKSDSDGSVVYRSSYNSTVSRLVTQLYYTKKFTDHVDVVDVMLSIRAIKGKNSLLMATEFLLMATFADRLGLVFFAS